MNLRLCVIGIKKHPLELMKDLEIKYDKATPYVVGDCWIFEDCENVPEELPEYLDKVELVPRNIYEEN